jgi:uncharacterized radical SAM superfamily protein
MPSQDLYEELFHATIEKIDETFAAAQSISEKNFGRKICFYAPSFMYYKTKHYCSSSKIFPSISITGSACALKCKHCGGKVLNTMYPVSNPEELFNLCVKLKEEGAVGCLISGGCLPNGSVPLNRYIDSLGNIKKKLGLTVFVHTGIIDEDLAMQLKSVGVDAALIDVIGSDETIREIYQLNVKVKDFDNSLRALYSAGISMVPHVLIGLHYGKIKGEIQALKLISKYSPSAIILIVFMPIRGTVMENIEPPPPEDVVKVMLVARLMFPKTPLVLGCMRPKGEYREKIDMMAVLAGLNAIAFPTEKAVELARALGYKTSFSSFCCSQIYRDLK